MNLQKRNKQTNNETSNGNRNRLIHINGQNHEILIFVYRKILLNSPFVFWSSGRPLLCFPRFRPFENVARIRRVYVAY